MQWIQTLATLMILCCMLMQVETQVTVSLHQAIASGAFGNGHGNVGQGETVESIVGDSTSFLPSTAITLVGACFVLAFYALIMYRRRAFHMEQRTVGPFNDQLGPPMLVAMIFAGGRVCLFDSVFVFISFAILSQHQNAPISELFSCGCADYNTNPPSF